MVCDLCAMSSRLLSNTASWLRSDKTKFSPALVHGVGDKTSYLHVTRPLVAFYGLPCVDLPPSRIHTLTHALALAPQHFSLSGFARIAVK